jgi:hypothetical protein
MGLYGHASVDRVGDDRAAEFAAVDLAVTAGGDDEVALVLPDVRAWDGVR